MNGLGIVLLALVMTSCVQTQEKNVCDTKEELVLDTVEEWEPEPVVEEIDVSADHGSMDYSAQHTQSSMSSFENRIKGTTWVSRNGCQKFEIYNGYVKAYINTGGYWQEIKSVSSQYSLSEDENAIYMKFGNSDNRTTIVFYKQTNTVIYRDGDNGTIQGQLEQEYI